MLDPLAQCGLYTIALGWTMWGCATAWDLYGHVRTRGGTAFLIAIAGPGVWAIAVYRLLTRARRAILRRAGVEGMTCCGGHHHHSGLDT